MDDTSYKPPVYHGAKPPWECEIPSGFSDTDPVEVFVPIRGDRTMRLGICEVHCEIDPDSETIVREDDGRILPTAAHLALIMASPKLLEAAIAVCRTFAALDAKLAAPSHIVLASDGTELARGDVFGPIANAIEALDSACREACDIEWLP